MDNPTRSSASPARGFVSTTPAETWEQGLITGNGTMGANMFCRPLDETVIITHERLFLPMGPPVAPPDTSARLFEVRRLIDRGLYKQATQLAFDLSGQDGFMYPDPFVPAFELSIRMPGEPEVTDYVRLVDFETGEAAVEWGTAAGRFDRRLFVSRPDRLIVLAVNGPGIGAIDARLGLRPRQPAAALPERQREDSARRFTELLCDVEATAADGMLTFRNGFTKAYPGSIHALEAVARVVAEGGHSATDGDTLVVTGADRLLVLIDVAVVYDPEQPRMPALRERLAGVSPDYHKLLTRHARVHGEIFRRMRLDIGGGSDHGRTTEDLLEQSTDEQLCPALVEKQFDAGRYNIICCTGELPPTLQGVWAGTYVPSWASDFTHNGNVPSAIASMLMGNMPELMLAYTSYIESIVPYLEVNARHLFGARGVVLPSRSTTHGYNNALAPNFAGGFWVAGAAWAAHFFYDYYLYTGDRDFLAEHALPFMEKVAVFFEDYLYEGDDGRYVFNPTTSPENFPENTKSQGTFNATMDVAAVRELLRNLIAGSREVGTNETRIPVWNEMLAKLPDYMISDAGYAKEWLTPRLDDALDHRHSSHLYALYDGCPEEIAARPELQAAFRRIIETKLDRHWKKSGFMSFGVVQLGQAAASLHEPELAYRCVANLANRYWLCNLASMHNHRALFNMDISGGMPAVIIKMLIASEPGRMELLPALPRAWPNGTIEGVLCRGQIEVRRLQWQPGRIRVGLLSQSDQTIMLLTPAGIASIETTEGAVAVTDAGLPNSRRLALPGGQPVELVITMKEGHDDSTPGIG